MRWFSCAAALMLAMLALPVAASADGQIRAVYTGGTEKLYPGLEIINATDAVYFVDVDAHQMVIVTKSGCSRQSNALTLCTGTNVTWDRYGVRSDLDAKTVSLYLNGTPKAVGIAGTGYTLTPNTLKVDIVTAQGTQITGLGYIDSTQAP